MKQTDSPNNEWEPCLHGMIHETAGQADVSRRRMARLLGLGAILVLLGTSVSIAMSDRNSRTRIPAEIGCIEVKQHLVSYTKGKILDKTMYRRIAFHLMKCKSCDSCYSEILCDSNPRSRHKRGKCAAIKPCPENNTP